MKIVFFDRERNVKEVFENMDNPTFYGRNEVRWNEGGYAFENSFYVILEHNQDFNDISDEEILRQFKEQAKFDLAKQIENNRIAYMVQGNLEEKLTQFEENKKTIDKAETIEEIELLLLEKKE